MALLPHVSNGHKSCTLSILFHLKRSNKKKLGLLEVGKRLMKFSRIQKEARFVANAHVEFVWGFNLAPKVAKCPAQ